MGGILRPDAPRQGRVTTFSWTMDLTDNEEDEALQELERLRQEHRDLDAAIDALERMAVSDRLQIQRLKKRKLGLRDRISYLEDLLTPDIIA
ncbi:MAG: hypothetical protein FD152_2907 [Xanthobacteraceae bacterium]|nr:MAG: hypothetical protein FD152_2907 [Xanthobacteraceae bacterium]